MSFSDIVQPIQRIRLSGSRLNRIVKPPKAAFAPRLNRIVSVRLRPLNRHANRAGFNLNQNHNAVFAEFAETLEGLIERRRATARIRTIDAA